MMYPSANPVRATRGFPDFCEASREIVSVALKFSRQPESSLDLIRLASFVIEFTGESGASRPPCVENTFTEANHSYLALVISVVRDIYRARFIVGRSVPSISFARDIYTRVTRSMSRCAETIRIFILFSVAEN